MAKIEWRDKLSIDGGVIDQDHRHLIDIINRFADMTEHFRSTDDALEILFSLRFYTKTHFAREEQLQRAAGFPYAEAHHKEHEALIRDLEKIIDDTQAAGDERIAEISRQTAQLLHDWLVDHIIKSDLRLQPYVEAMKAEAGNLGTLKDVDYV